MTDQNNIPGINPVPAVSIAVFKKNSVLIAKRDGGQLKGIWSLPGGHIEPGEKAIEAAQRELLEETGVTAAGIQHLACHDVILRNKNGFLKAHYVLNVYCGTWKKGHAQAATDISDVRWVALGQLSKFSLTPGAQDLIFRASKLILD